MKRLSLFGLALAFALALPGCDDEEAKNKAIKVFKDYYKLCIEATKAGKETDHKAFKNQAAKANGFAGWGDFVNKASQLLGPKAWMEVIDEATTWYDEQMRNKGREEEEEEDGEEEGEEEEDEEEEWELPPIFRKGAKVGDLVAREYYAVHEVRGEWIRGDFYKIRGDVRDRVAKDVWVHVPGKGWNWVVIRD
ncbi:MAG: hypothetical protein ACYTHM_01635 [Planctomycetota bacterium]|jgi:hypothetical protein